MARINFIPELRALIRAQLTTAFRFNEDDITKAFVQWDSGGLPRTGVERLIFAALTEVQDNIRKGE